MNKKTLSVTCWEGQMEFIQQAAELADVSVSEYVRAHVLLAAAADLRRAVPDFPPFEPPRFRRGEITKAAEALGMTNEQFKQQMALKAAHAVLEELTAPAARPPSVPPPSGIRGPADQNSPPIAVPREQNFSNQHRLGGRRN